MSLNLILLATIRALLHGRSVSITPYSLLKHTPRFIHGHSLSQSEFALVISMLGITISNWSQISHSSRYLSSLHVMIGYLCLHFQPQNNILVPDASFSMLYDTLRYSLLSFTLEEMLLIGFRKPALALVGTAASGECMICLDSGSMMQYCSQPHVSHPSCMSKWISVSQNHTCPMCRRNLNTRKVTSIKGLAQRARISVVGLVIGILVWFAKIGWTQFFYMRMRRHAIKYNLDWFN